jgi:stage V sporulation protein SpoVS
MKREYNLPCYGITVRIDEYGMGAIESTLRENLMCDIQDVAGSAAGDAVEALILAHACAGVDIEAQSYVIGLERGMEAIANNME